jgi:hypothetical protein
MAHFSLLTSQAQTKLLDATATTLALVSTRPLFVAFIHSWMEIGPLEMALVGHFAVIGFLFLFLSKQAPFTRNTETLPIQTSSFNRPTCHG